MYVNIGSATNSCQKTDRLARLARATIRAPSSSAAPASGGSRPTARPAFRRGRRWATGLRNAMALAMQPGTGALLAAVHGRDQLGDNWGFSDEANANNPAEELVQVEQDDDYRLALLLLQQRTGRRCSRPSTAATARTSAGAPGQGAGDRVPGSLGPDGARVLSRTRSGRSTPAGCSWRFTASWNRAPLPQEGYRVVFVPFANGRPTGEYSDLRHRSRADPTALRASGVAVGQDGSLFISADQNGKIWRVT